MKTAVTAVAAASLVWLAWLLRIELVVLFAAVMFGTALYSCARWVVDRTGLGHRVATGVLSGLGIAVLVAIFTFTGQRLGREYSDLGSRIPAGIEALEARVSGVPVLGSLEGALQDLREGLSPEAGGSGEGEAGGSQDAGGGSPVPMGPTVHVLSLTLTSLGHAALIFVLALYIGLEGHRYASAAVRLVPPRHRDVAEELTSALGTALPRWLMGRLASMGAVALLTLPGLLLLGIPLPWVLGLIAGLFSFVPILGPIAGAIPAFLVTLEADPGLIWWVVGLYMAVQVAESWIVTPMIQDRMVSLPPLVLLGAQLLLGTMVGIAGVMFSTPLALAILTTVQVVLLKNAYGDEDTDPIGT